MSEISCKAHYFCKGNIQIASIPTIEGVDSPQLFYMWIRNSERITVTKEDLEDIYATLFLAMNYNG